LKIIWLKASLPDLVRFFFVAKMYVYRFVPADVMKVHNPDFPMHCPAVGSAAR
jgi:hypothetical protein